MSKQEILNKVEEYYNEEHQKAPFKPGEDVIHYAGRIYDSEEMKAITEAALDFQLTDGRFIKEFEKLMADYIGVKYAVLVNSGSSANLLAVAALSSHLLPFKRSLVHGDNIITVAAGFPTTVNPIIQMGYVPNFIDIDKDTLNIDVNKIEASINGRTRAIMIAHTLGNPFNVDAILSIARKHNLMVIEDACDSLGSTFMDQKVGSFGDMATFSFYPAHHITMGEGGMVVTDDPLLYRILKSLRDWGRECHCSSGIINACGKEFTGKFGDLPVGYDHRYVYSHIGYNLKATEMQAAIGVAQFKKLPYFIIARKVNFTMWEQEFRKYSEFFRTIKHHPLSDPSWFGFGVTVKESAPFTRTELTKYLQDKKIETRNLFGGNLLKQPMYKNIRKEGTDSFPNTDLIMSNTFFLGVYPGIECEHIKYTMACIEAFIKEHV